jgi:hypothetical protein
MSIWVWILIAVAVVVAVGLVVWGIYRKQQTSRLRSTFGPEYERTVEAAEGRREAESDLRTRQRRRAQLEIVVLSPAARQRYAESWRDTQARFVDSPADSIRRADGLVTEVMRDRGYPMENFEQRAADVSVDHPNVVEDYRAGHGISLASEHGRATTEDLRQAMVHYRALFLELLGSDDEQSREETG